MVKTLPHSPTQAEIDLDALAFNVAQVRRLGGKGKKILAVVKANAYGHGIRHVAEFLSGSPNLLAFGVASIEEGRGRLGTDDVAGNDGFAANHLVAEGKEPRHHDGATPCPSKRRQSEIALAQPPQHVHGRYHPSIIGHRRARGKGAGRR